MSDYSVALTVTGIWMAGWANVFARLWVTRPAGAPAPARHRMSRPPVRAVVDEVTLETLLPPWPDRAPSYGVLAQAWKWCGNCCRTEPSVLNKDGWLCGHCCTPIPADGVELSDAA
ncbi:hypothetical protein [Streptomyces sp. B21-083]|uniref:hypothetical protein n=1 Tax=Streptomyces sp. B21-083 TaxID=3039410 RepID=UPI002FF25BFB